MTPRLLLSSQVVGLPNVGTLSEQVHALLQTTGVVVPAAPPAGGTSAATPRSFATQTKPNYYELLQEQKRRDGL